MKLKLKFNKIYKEMFPRPTKEQYAELKADIKKNGQILPISYSTRKNDVLDGYTRYQVCKELEITPYVDPIECETELDEIDFILSMNGKRRDLTSVQRFFAHEKYYEEVKKLNEKYKNKGGVEKSPHGWSAENLAKRAGIAPSVVHRIIYIQAHGTELDNKDLKEGVAKVTTIQGRITKRKFNAARNNADREELKLDAKSVNPHKRKRVLCPRCAGQGRVWDDD